MIPYIIHSSILIAICFLFYHLFLQQITFFKGNRWLLLLFLFISFALPFLQVPQEWSLRNMAASDNIIAPLEIPALPLEIIGDKEIPEVPTLNLTEPNVYEKYKTNIPELANSKIGITEKTSQSSWLPNFSWSLVLRNLYLIGLAFFIGRLILHFSALVFKIITNTAIKDGKYRIINIDQDIAPCSFWNCIFLNPNKYDRNIYEQIIKHEKIHISEWHSIDILLTELLIAIQWFNPFAWLYRKTVENNLEYLTDQRMLVKGTDKKAYQMSLLKVSVPHYSPYLATNYNHSFLKKRIIMMNVKKSPVYSTWKYLLVIPILGLSIICLNAVKSVANDDPPQTVETTEAPNTDQATKNTSSNEINSELNEQKENEQLDIALNENNSDEINYYPLNGKWEGEIKGNKVCLVFKSKNNQYGMIWDSDNCADKSEFSNIPMNSVGEFTLTREAGTMTFNGKFANGKGEGDYSFSEDKSFRDYLSKEGISDVSEKTMMHAFITNINKIYITEIKQLGFNIDSEDFETLSRFGTSIQTIKNYSRDLKSIGYRDFTLNDIAHLEIHDASIDYIKEMHQLGFKNLTLDKMVQASIHNVTPDYFRELKAAGLENIEFEDLIQFAIHNIEPGYVKEMQNLSSRKLTNQEIIQAGIHNVSVEYFDELKGAGMDDMEFQELVQFSIHNISPGYVKEMQNLSSRKLTSQDIIQAGIHNVSTDYFDELKEAGMGDMPLQELIQFSIHNISPEYVKEMQNLSSRKLTSQEIIQAGIHNVSTDYFDELKEAGMEGMSLEELIQFSIHNISPKYVKEMQNLTSRKLSSKEIIQAGIHNVSTDYFDELKEAGLQDISLEELIQFSIHNVRPKFITDIKKLGYENLPNEEIIQASIHGVNAKYISSLQEVGIKNEPIRKIIEARIHNVTAEFIKKVKASEKKDLTLDDYIEKKIRGWREER